MYVGRIALLGLGAAAGVLVVYALARPDSVKSTTVATLRAGIKAKDWAAEKYDKAKEEVKALAQEARKEPAQAS